jgi:hypothetical protein
MTAIEELISNKEKKEKVLQDCKKLLTMLVNNFGVKSTYETKEIVKITTLSYKEVQSLLELLLAFGFIKFEKGSHEFRFLLDDEDVIDNFLQEINNYCENFTNDFVKLVDKFNIFILSSDLDEEQKKKYEEKIIKLEKECEKLLKICQKK